MSRISGATRHVVLALISVSMLLVGASTASANTSHEGWPAIQLLLMHKLDEHGVLRGNPGLHNELLGGHGNDIIVGGNRSDVLWGDYKPSGQPETQVDTMYGGPGRDFIYASHGRNNIYAGAGNDWIKAHFGTGGVIDCGSGRDLLYISRRAQPHYQIRHCERISHRTLGY